MAATIVERAQQATGLLVETFPFHDELTKSGNDAGVFRPGLTETEKRRLGCVEGCEVRSAYRLSSESFPAE